MRRAVLAGAATVLGISVLLPAFAQKGPSAEGLLSSNDCRSCHRVALPQSGEAVPPGPSFRQVAMRYRNVPGAEARLVKKIQNGGSGQWGINNMPPQYVPESDLHVIVRWILALK